MTRGTPAPSRRRGLGLLALLVPLALAVSACDGDGTGPDEDETSILGTWVLTQGTLTSYLVITTSTVTQYVAEEGDCVSPFVLEIVGQSGDTYTLDSGAGTFDVTFTREGDNLRVEDEGGTAVYAPTTDDPSELEQCVFPDDPGISCQALPEIRPGQSVDGTLSETDPVLWEGEYYDLYGLRVAVAADVVIAVSSEDFDTYVVLFSGDGEYIAENDDFNWPESTDSRLEASLEPGCFRVVVTSYDRGETGGYSLRVD